MLSEDTKTLKFNDYQKSGKVPFIFYADLECIIKKIDGCKNNPIIFRFPGFSISIVFSFRSIENKHDVYSGKVHEKVL